MLYDVSGMFLYRMAKVNLPGNKEHTHVLISFVTIINVYINRNVLI